MSSQSARVGFDVEKSIDASTFIGDYLPIGTPLTVNPVVIVFDNQSTVDVPVSVDQATTWKTFSAGEAFILDLRSNHGTAYNYTMDLGTQFYTNAEEGTGSFRITNVYAR